MATNRRTFLLSSSAAVLGAADATRAQTPGNAEAAAPAAAGAKPPAVTPATFAEAEKLMQVTLTEKDRAQAAASWEYLAGGLVERRVGPRVVEIGPDVPPYSIWHRPAPGPAQERFFTSDASAGPLPADDAGIAFAPVWKLAAWIRARRLTSERLTSIYLARIERLDPRVRSVITVTKDHALAQARKADRDVKAGRYRGPLHGIPWGAKDLVDTAGIRTTYGAEPFRTRVPKDDATVVQRLNDAGAVLVAKLSMGALAMNDIWFGGQTQNPWLLEEGSSGSSAGSGAALAAGLVAFAIGSETEGSIVSPSYRCGVAGLRPTFGRVPRTGSMTLCWSLDKLGPMARSVEDTMFVLRAISGADAGDPASVTRKIDYDARRPVKGLRIGYVRKWMDEAPASDVDRAALAAAGRIGLVPVEVSLPDWPVAGLRATLFAEAAASFETWTLTRTLDQLSMQTNDSWPNIIRQSRFISAVDMVQADRLRTRFAQAMQDVMSRVDLVLAPSMREEMLTLSNFTGHPSLTMRAGFTRVAEARSDWAPDPARPLPKFDPPRRVPQGVTLVGRHFDEGTLARVGVALERALGVAGETPPGFV